MPNNDKYSIYFSFYCYPFPLCSLGEEGASGRLISQLSAATQRQAEREAQAPASQPQALRVTQGWFPHSFLSPPLTPTHHPWGSNSVPSGRYWGFMSLKCK